MELLSDFQISIPELGTIKAKYRPIVILTSNRTRELSDALKRRCLYHWIDYPDFEREISIIRKRFPAMNASIAVTLVKFVQYLRNMKLRKSPGIAESIDWAQGILSLQIATFSRENIEKTLGCVLKSEADIQLIKQQGISQILEEINA